MKKNGVTVLMLMALLLVMGFASRQLPRARAPSPEASASEAHFRIYEEIRPSLMAAHEQWRALCGGAAMQAASE